MHEGASSAAAAAEDARKVQKGCTFDGLPGDHGGVSAFPALSASFLHTVVQPHRSSIDARHIAVVVAHPDDETVGCGALLARLGGVCVVVVTDGSPDDLCDAQAAGCQSRAQYAARRAVELMEALQIAGIPAYALTCLGIRDQRAAFHLKDIGEQLARIFVQRKIQLVLTHAFEGGHPDHDATAFAVHRAASAAPHKPEIVEMPYYRLGDHGEERQSFAAGCDAPISRMYLNFEERVRKHRMIEAHHTQALVLAGFSRECEQFRVAPEYDFSRLPNNGRLLYELHSWGLTGREWLSRVRETAFSP